MLVKQSKRFPADKDAPGNVKTVSIAPKQHKSEKVHRRKTYNDNKSMYDYRKQIKDVVDVWYHPYLSEMLVIKQGNRLTKYKHFPFLNKVEGSKRELDGKEIGFSRSIKCIAISKDLSILILTSKNKLATGLIGGQRYLDNIEMN